MCRVQILLCFALLFSHACNARPFSAQLSTKKNIKGCLLYKSILLPAQPSTLIKLENGMRKEAKVAHHSNIQTDCRDDRRSESDEYVKMNTKAANVEAHSAAGGAPEMASWKLLFLMDYSPPKRRPPVHN
ncbi:hypothetical protein POM88_002414 [Heracleum sosnowskyi]|uniref:Uncharacterized protein n=1 Tax=Heracleum sosnowskyi TaxID=360622 RepID=A0AAD8JG23_9APIA|nr:hypothetical protein POM88_002414 [Heracleum sosnowskyi]